jgi:hypothetical protein
MSAPVRPAQSATLSVPLLVEVTPDLAYYRRLFMHLPHEALTATLANLIQIADEAREELRHRDAIPLN